MKHLLNNNHGDADGDLMFILGILAFFSVLGILAMSSNQIEDSKICKQILITDIKTGEEVSFYGTEVRSYSDGDIYFTDVLGIEQKLMPLNAKISIQQVDSSFCISQPESQPTTDSFKTESLIQKGSIK